MLCGFFKNTDRQPFATVKHFIYKLSKYTVAQTTYQLS